MRSVRSLPDVEAEFELAEAAIRDAYWTYTRTARGKPPCLVVPWAYARRRELTAERRLILMSTPNLTTESGREQLALDERRSILASEAAWFRTWTVEAERPLDDDERRVRRALVELMEHTVSYSGDNAYAELARVECLVLAWRRGGAVEHARVHRVQVDRRVGLAGYDGPRAG